ncbi:MAG: hypothetical protein MUC92_06705 [Fimbriimonadaceae bacterium]|nr:hypothetical protein [Fimbriimonadaceae bacterium]
MIVALPVLTPLLIAALMICLWQSPKARIGVSILGGVLQLVLGVALFAQVLPAGHLVTQFGNWPAPFGISFVADYLSAGLVLMTGVLTLAMIVTSNVDVDSRRRQYGFHPLFFVLIAGVCGAFLTGDLFNMFVWFECTLLASFVLLSLGGEKKQVRGGLQYVVPNLFGSVIFLSGIGLLYGATGTLNFADLHQKASLVHPGLLASISGLFLVCFGLKAAVFPFFSWLPTSYPTPPPVITALFAGLLTKVGVYALVRTFTLVFPMEGIIQTVLITLSCLTMIIGVVAAASQKDFKHILAYHSMSQIGYMTAGLALGTKFAFAATVLYMIHHSLVKANLFLIAGSVERTSGSSELPSLGGFHKARPFLAILFVLMAASLAGLPPSSGFWSKLFVVQSSLRIEQFVVAGVMLAVSLLTLFSMVKVWNEVFLKEPKEPIPPLKSAVDHWPIAFVAVTVLLFGFWIQPFSDYALEVGQQLSTPQIYVEAVLGVAR